MAVSTDPAPVPLATTLTIRPWPDDVIDTQRLAMLLEGRTFQP